MSTARTERSSNGREQIRYKKIQNSVSLGRNETLALASQEGVEQIQGGKTMQAKMNEDDRQGPTSRVGTSSSAIPASP